MNCGKPRYAASISSQSCLPHHIILDILLSLPVKALLKFKCICKSWYALIRSPSFINCHYSQEQNRELLLIRHSWHDKEFYYGLPLDEMFCEHEGADYLQLPNMGVEFIMGPVDGIFCVVSQWWRMALWNPATREFRLIPFIHSDYEPPVYGCDDITGFGMDPLTGQYKLVWIQHIWNTKLDILHPCLVSVYYSGSDSWTYFDDESINLKYSWFTTTCNTFVNRIFYWLISTENLDFVILTFDMSNDTLGEIQVPDCTNGVSGVIAVYGNSIALLSRNADDDGFDAWVMEEKARWVKKLSIGPFNDIRSTTPLGLWRESELLVETQCLSLTLVNLNTKEARTIEARKETEDEDDSSSVYWYFPYKESLLPLKREGLRCGQFEASSDLVKDFFEKPLSNLKKF